MESTIVSMTDETGKTGNVDYRDCHFPSDAELVEAARRYGLERGIRFTITTVVGAKTKFVANIEQGKLVHVTPVTQNLNALERICESVCTQEVERLSKYKDFNFNTSEILDAVGISEEEVWSMVESKKSGKDSIFSRSWNKITLAAAVLLNKNWEVQFKGWIPIVDGKENKDMFWKGKIPILMRRPFRF